MWVYRYSIVTDLMKNVWLFGCGDRNFPVVGMFLALISCISRISSALSYAVVYQMLPLFSGG